MKKIKVNLAVSNGEVSVVSMSCANIPVDKINAFLKSIKIQKQEEASVKFNVLGNSLSVEDIKKAFVLQKKLRKTLNLKD